MATITIRGLDDRTRERLRVRAAEHGRSMEAEVRAILSESVTTTPEPEGGLGSRIHARFAGLTGEGLVIAARQEEPRAAEFSK